MLQNHNNYRDKFGGCWKSKPLTIFNSIQTYSTIAAIRGEIEPRPRNPRLLKVLLTMPNMHYSKQITHYWYCKQFSRTVLMKRLQGGLKILNPIWKCNISLNYLLHLSKEGIKKLIQPQETIKWRNEMEAKQMLNIYRIFKADITYNNDEESRILFLSQSNRLR